MTLRGRILGAVSGAMTGWNTAGTMSLVPRRDVPFGHVQDRMVRYDVSYSYYYNTIFDVLNQYSAWIMADESLYKFIRGIVNPVKQENDLIVSYTYKGSIDPQNLQSGALPLVYENEALEPALKQLIKWSNLDQQLALYVRDAALYGDTAWWLVDDPVARRVRLELVDPARIKLVDRDEVGNVKAAVLEYVCEDTPDVERYIPGNFGMQIQTTRTYIKTIKITKDTFYTYKDGKPFAFYTDPNGKLVEEWDNPYGFVPLKLAHYQIGKDGWGQNSFFGTPRRMIDELNDQASIINDSIRTVIAPIVMARNVRNSSEIKVAREDRDSMSILYVPGDNASLEPVTIPIDIAGANQTYTQKLTELKKAMPVLSLQDIRDKGGNLSGVAIANMFGDAISIIENVRKNLNAPLIAALQMAITIGGIRGYEGFRGFNLNSYDAGDMELSVKDTAVIDDKLSKSERVDKIISIAPLPTGSKRVALAEIGYTDSDIEDIITEDDAQKQAAMQQFQQNANGQNVPLLTAGQGQNGQKPPINDQQASNGKQPTQTPDSSQLQSIWERIGLKAAAA